MITDWKWIFVFSTFSPPNSSVSVSKYKNLRKNGNLKAYKFSNLIIWKPLLFSFENNKLKLYD